MKVALVGDLSQQAPELLDKAITAAMANADVVVQLGDVNPGYDVIRKWLPTGKLLVIPGNHDTQGPGNWDAELPGQPKQWSVSYPQPGSGTVRIIGLDNTRDVLDDEAHKLVVEACNASDRYDAMLVCMHKSLTTLMLPDGSESRHVMGEGGQIPNDSAQSMIELLRGERCVAICCGHYHGQSVMQTPYGTVLLEGRGGAPGTPNLGYTLILTTCDGWTAHSVTL
jgi:hypothetical protein